MHFNRYRCYKHQVQMGVRLLTFELTLVADEPKEAVSSKPTPYRVGPINVVLRLLVATESIRFRWVDHADLEPHRNWSPPIV